MSSRIFLCSDLDRTILPNGAQPESPQARERLRQLAQRSEITLAYVSGRHEALLQAAIADFAIPTPDFAVGDVGTTIYEIKDGDWHPWHAWSEEIAPDWAGAEHDDLAHLFRDIDALRLQEDEKQNTFKLSYYTPSDITHKTLVAEMQERLRQRTVNAAVIWSIDEEADLGLIDVLPASATKLHAVRFLMEQLRFDEEHTVFAGDSGNDLPVVTSGLQSVLVKNAHPDVIHEAQERLAQRSLQHKLYVAQGDFLGMNGNYSAGVLEGLAHFIPETKTWLE